MSRAEEARSPDRRARLFCVTHGALEDTDNQLRTPHRLGEAEVPGVLVRGYMAALIIGEVGGFLIVFLGAMWPG